MINIDTVSELTLANYNKCLLIKQIFEIFALYICHSLGTDIKEHAVNDEAALRLDLLEKESSENRLTDDIKRQIAKLSAEYERIEGNSLSDYTKYRNGIYSEEEYLKIWQDNKELLESIQSRIDSLKESFLVENEQEPKETTELINAFGVLTEYDGDVLGKLVEKVYIYNDKDIEVVFK